MLRMLRRRIARLLRRGLPTDVEIERELRDHLELDAEALASERRAAPGDARFAAQRRFGNTSRVRESVRDVWRWTWFEQLEQDVRHHLWQRALWGGLHRALSGGVGRAETARAIARRGRNLQLGHRAAGQRGQRGQRGGERLRRLAQHLGDDWRAIRRGARIPEGRRRRRRTKVCNPII